MALLITSSGIVSHIMPENGTFFRRDELDTIMQCAQTLTESLKRRGRQMTFVASGSGGRNDVAQTLYKAMGGTGEIEGNVLVCEKTQIL